MAALIAPSILTPMLVPAVTLAETSVPKIRGNLTTPRTSPTRPPTKPITNPTNPKIIRDKKSANGTIYFIPQF